MNVNKLEIIIDSDISKINKTHLVIKIVLVEHPNVTNRLDKSAIMLKQSHVKRVQ